MKTPPIRVTLEVLPATRDDARAILAVLEREANRVKKAQSAA